MKKINRLESSLLLSKAISLVGTTFFNTGINLIIVSEYGGGDTLGAVLAIGGISSVLFGVIGGYLSDIVDKVKLIKFLSFLSAIICFLSLLFIEENVLVTISILVFLLNMNNSFMISATMNYH